MAQLEVPPAAEPGTADPGPAPESPPPRWAGDDAIPRGLAVTSAISLRVIIVVGGIVLLGLFAKLMLVVVLPLIIALLLATLLSPLARWLRARRVRPAAAAFLSVLLAVAVFVGLWALVIPPFVSQVPIVVDNVQQGAGQIADALEPLGVTSEDVQRSIQQARDQLRSNQVAGQVLSGALLVVQWAAAILLIVVLTFFFLKDGEQLREWTVSLFVFRCRTMLREVLDRA